MLEGWRARILAGLAACSRFLRVSGTAPARCRRGVRWRGSNADCSARRRRTWQTGKLPFPRILQNGTRGKVANMPLMNS